MLLESLFWSQRKTVIQKTQIKARLLGGSKVVFLVHVAIIASNQLAENE